MTAKKNKVPATTEPAVTIQTFDVTEQAIEKLKAEYMVLKVKDLNDKEGYAKVKEAKKKMVTMRNAVENKRKGLNEAALKHQRLVNELAKGIQNKLLPIETHLDDQMAPIDKETARIELEEKNRLDARYKERTVLLSANGMKFDGTHLTLDHLQYDTQSIRTMEEVEFQDCLLLVKTQHEANTAELALQTNAALEKEKALKEKEIALMRKEAKLTLSAYAIPPDQQEQVIDRVIELHNTMGIEIEEACLKIGAEMFPSPLDTTLGTQNDGVTINKDINTPTDKMTGTFTIKEPFSHMVDDHKPTIVFGSPLNYNNSERSIQIKEVPLLNIHQEVKIITELNDMLKHMESHPNSRELIVGLQQLLDNHWALRRYYDTSAGMFATEDKELSAQHGFIELKLN